MQIKAKIENWVRETLGRSECFSLVHPKDLKNGDFTLIINGDGAKADFDKLEQSLRQAQGDFSNVIGKIEFVAPRFINIYLSESFFAESIGEINEKGEGFGSSNLLNGEKTIIEYTVTNVLKPMHIGHLMGNVLGEALSRILEQNGAEIKRNNIMTSTQQRAALQRQIWQIANDVRGAVDGWDFKQYVLGTLFYRFISENFASYIEVDDGSITYAELPDNVITPEIKDDFLKTKGTLFTSLMPN